MSKKYIYSFEEGNSSMKDLLGGKGANLAEMTNIGLPVPQGFTITTEACNFYSEKNTFPEELENQYLENLKLLENKTNKKFGDNDNPLLVSVRSGAKFSMPGMMDTVLNLGLNDNSINGLIKQTNNERFAYDAYRRFIAMFSNIVLGIKMENFEKILERLKDKFKVHLDTELTTENLKEVVEEYKNYLLETHNINFEQNPYIQLKMAIEAVFKSWNSPRAKIYRQHEKISDNLGTAVNIQSMVFGNMGDTSATGVAFTRNPSTGDKGLYGEYLINAQGEDVVAGLRTPDKIQNMEKTLPEVYKQFLETAKILENHYKDMQDLEFTVEKNKLYMLQTRNAKRTIEASLKVAFDMVNEGVLTKKEAIKRIEPLKLNNLLHRQIDTSSQLNVIAQGLPASPGAASGVAVFDPDLAEKLGKDGKKVILVRIETSPDDIHGIIQAQGVLTSRGGMTSHAAVVARGMGKPCVAGCESIRVDLEEKLFRINDLVIKEGDYFTINGGTGEVILGEVKMKEPEMSEAFKTLLEWANEIKNMGVRANADNPEDAKKAREFGAKGIGLCRTEHMFMEQDRLPIVQKMIMSETRHERKKYLDQLLPIQRKDFEGILKAMEGYPVTIRLLDPPLHEFLPNYKDLLTEVITLKITENNPDLLIEKQKLLKKLELLHEANPMMGLRGCRLGITFPEINEMQVRAIIEATINLKKQGINALPEIMIPLIGHANELKVVKQQLEKVAKVTMEEHNEIIDYKFGTMIEIPRAAITADEIAEHAEFFSFGTNDLTQMTFGYSRDDAENKFLQKYLEGKILPSNPFDSIDQKGVGELIKMAVEKGRKVKPDIKLGVCGEHGGDPESIKFVSTLGLSYVSCSPYRVPIAIFSSAQAT
ncbi:MAG: pyruvate, phosphate dikinase [Candidatus Sericytochromatia bacterium]